MVEDNRPASALRYSINASANARSEGVEAQALWWSCGRQEERRSSEQLDRARVIVPSAVVAQPGNGTWGR